MSDKHKHEHKPELEKDEEEVKPELELNDAEKALEELLVEGDFS